MRLDPNCGFALISLANLRFLEGRLEEAWEFLSSVAEIYLEAGLPSNLKELSYFMRTLAGLVEEGGVPKKIREAVEDLLGVLVSDLPAEAPPELLMLKLAMGLDEEDLGRWREQEMRGRRMRMAPINPDAPLEEVLSRYNKYVLVGMGKILQLKGPLEALKKAELVGKICAHLRDLRFLGGPC